MGVEVLMVGALGWPAPTEAMEFWRLAFGELSMAARKKTLFWCQAGRQVARSTIHLSPNAANVFEFVLVAMEQWQHDKGKRQKGTQSLTVTS